MARHLREDVVVWMTTVTPAGAPLPMPVWFHWDGGEHVVMYSQRGARIRNLEANPRVTLNFAGDGGGGDIVVLSERRRSPLTPRLPTSIATTSRSTPSTSRSSG